MLAAAAALSRKVYDDTFSENYSRYGLALLPWHSPVSWLFTFIILSISASNYPFS